MTDLPEILSQIEHRDTTASEQLLPLVYNERRQRALGLVVLEKRGHTLQPTPLVDYPLRFGTAYSL